MDGIPLDGVHSVRIHNAIDYLCAESGRIIRWTEVFLIELSQRETRGEPLDVNRLCEGLARACCVALAPCLDVLVDNGQTCLGLRVHVSSEKVRFVIRTLISCSIVAFSMCGRRIDFIILIFSYATNNDGEQVHACDCKVMLCLG